VRFCSDRWSCVFRQRWLNEPRAAAAGAAKTSPLTRLPNFALPRRWGTLELREIPGAKRLSRHVLGRGSECWGWGHGEGSGGVSQPFLRCWKGSWCPGCLWASWGCRSEGWDVHPAVQSGCGGGVGAAVVSWRGCPDAHPGSGGLLCSGCFSPSSRLTLLSLG